MIGSGLCRFGVDLECGVWVIVGLFYWSAGFADLFFGAFFDFEVSLGFDFDFDCSELVWG